MAQNENCFYCGERYHVRHWCLRAPDNWEKMSEWMQAHATNGKIIPRSQYIAIAKAEGVPAVTTLERQVAGTWRDVAAAFGLLAGETNNKKPSRMDEARFTYNVHRDDVQDNGLPVQETPRRVTWRSPRDGMTYTGDAWEVR